MIFKSTLLAIAAMPLIAAAGDTAQGGEDLISYILKGGPFGVVVLLLVFDKLCTPSERDRLRVELTAAHNREEKLNENIRTDIVPLITQNNETLTTVIKYLSEQDVQRRIEEAKTHGPTE